ncbi:hypothetical protein M0638_07240 [Roseomonas sp. NAR14]|uniref:Uncharacterized protein n=1 Tax=Roseomonas acroporae TaxID=2937791 RepID=A0A9X2BVM9_9PROT|nr:hypothetical protein [Roseomonas acroporae]MCK8784169.1 hypothetical protein [Roseomonas acroporae]
MSINTTAPADDFAVPVRTDGFTVTVRLTDAAIGHLEDLALLLDEAYPDADVPEDDVLVRLALDMAAEQARDLLTRLHRSRARAAQATEA